MQFFSQAAEAVPLSKRRLHQSFPKGRATVAAMAMAGLLRLTAKVAQWVLLVGVTLAGVGLVGWVLSVFRAPSSFLMELGILSLPVMFVGIVLFFVVAVGQTMGRRRPGA
jgi:hypothetical protein